MWNLLSPDNEFAKVVSKIMDLVFLSLLWLFLSCTIIGIGPATVALYYAVVKSIRRDRGSAFQAFFHAIKENWKSSLLFGLLFAAFVVSVLMYDVPNILAYFTLDTHPGLGIMVLSFLKLFLLGSIFLYIFPLISRFRISFSGAVLTSLLLSVRHILSTLALFVITFAGIWLVSFAPFMLFFLPSVIVYAYSFLIEPILKQMLSDGAHVKDENEDQWYLE